MAGALGSGRHRHGDGAWEGGKAPARGRGGQNPTAEAPGPRGERLALVVLAICAIICALGWLRGEPLLLMFLAAVSLAVAASPEALPAAVTSSLAWRAQSMVQDSALMRQ